MESLNYSTIGVALTHGQVDVYVFSVTLLIDTQSLPQSQTGTMQVQLSQQMFQKWQWNW